MGSEYDKHLERVHSGWRVSPQVLREALDHVSRAQIANCRKLVEGETNEVYDVELADGLAVIVRIARSSPGSFDRERWAIDKCRGKQIPVPDIMSISHHEEEPVSIEACVQRKAEGQLLSRYEGTAPDRARLVRRCGELLRRVHGIDTVGFGYIDENGRGRFGSAREEAVDYRSLEPQLVAAARSHGLDRPLLDDALAFVVAMIESREVQPCLLHNDFEPKHILVSGGKVSAIIDFGESASGDSVNDLVRFSVFESGSLLKDFLAGYGECDLSRLPVYRVGFCLFQIAGSHSKGFSAGVIDGAMRLRQQWRSAFGVS